MHNAITTRFTGLRAALALLAVALFSVSATAQPGPDLYRVLSPDGRMMVTVTADEAIPRYEVVYNDEIVVAPSRLGIRFLDGMDLDSGLTLVGAEGREVRTSWEQPWGERRVVADEYNELEVHFTGADRDGFTLRVRVYDTGLGFRYEVPGDAENPQRRIIDEITEFNLSPIETAWWIEAGGWNRYEYLYRTTPGADVATAHTPITFKLENGLYVAIHEAALVDYSGMWIEQRRPGSFEAKLAPSSEGYAVLTEGAFKTPWRTIQVGPRAVDLINSDLIINLNEPNALGDVSWVKPSKYVGIWWCMHIEACTWGSGPKHGATTERTKEYIDFAAKYGFDGVLVEGWNTGWDGDWFNNGEVFSFTEAYPDFNIEELAAYAAAKGVYLIGHHETSGNTVNYERQLEAALDLYARLGIPAIKTGYVADGGDLVVWTPSGRTGMAWHDGQEAVAHHALVIREAAKRGISINAHEPVKDTGLRRTYPNYLSREGARGQEYNAWGVPPNPPEHTTLLPFTRMLSGPMDFTPGIFDLTFGKDPSEDPRVQTTLAKQLALYVVLYSPIQMAADLPENYEARPEAFEFIREVPVDWEESIALDGEPGEFVVFARKDRNSANWYIGAVTDENARTVTIPLDFLDREGEWTLTVYADGPDADWRTNPYEFMRETITLTPEQTLVLELAPGGGAAVSLSPVLTPEPVISDSVTGTLLRIPAFPASGILDRDVMIWLPPGYGENETTRYPVLYMHDAQNLLRTEGSYTGIEWGVDETMTRLIEDGSIRPAIVVAIGNTPDRWRDYVPNGIVRQLPDAIQQDITDNSGAILSDRYLAFIVNDLKPWVDASFRTLPGKADTMIAGSSMGGLISLYALGEYPDVFGAGAAISTHWPLGMPGDIPIDDAIAATQAWLDSSGLDPATQRIWFDHGTETLDSHYEPYQTSHDAWLLARGFVPGTSMESTVYEGTNHSEQAWAARLDDIFIFLLGVE